jgi:hypothetical protein
MPKKPRTKSQGRVRLNRRVPNEILGGLEGDEPARGFIMEQDREIAEKGGRAWHPAEDDLADTTPARRHELSGLFALAIRDGVARLPPAGRHTDTAGQNHIVTALVSHHTARHTLAGSGP